MSEFRTRIYAALRKVPKGKVTTYKALANVVGSKAYRAVGQCMRHNPFDYSTCQDPNKRIPCHRVVASSGAIGGFMGQSTGALIRMKIALLTQEGIHIHNGKIKHLKGYLYQLS